MSTMMQEEFNGAADHVLRMKASANQLYSSRDYFGAASIYSSILNQFKQAISPDIIRVVQCNRAACLIELGRYPDAITDLLQVVQVKVNTYDGVAVTSKAHFRLARVYCELGRYGDAMQEMERYRELIGGQPQTAETALYTKILRGIIGRQSPEQCAPQAQAHAMPLSPVQNQHPRPQHAAGGGSAIPPVRNNNGMHQLRYEIRVYNVPGPIVHYDVVPAALCTAQPPEMPTRVFLANLVRKHHEAVMALRPWACWNCPARAVSLVHTPASYIHLAEPQVVDFAQPVCVNGGECERAARQMMDKEMRRVAAAAQANRSNAVI